MTRRDWLKALCVAPFAGALAGIFGKPRPGRVDFDEFCYSFVWHPKLGILKCYQSGRLVHSSGPGTTEPLPVVVYTRERTKEPAEWTMEWF